MCRVAPVCPAVDACLCLTARVTPVACAEKGAASACVSVVTRHRHCGSRPATPSRQSFRRLHTHVPTPSHDVNVSRTCTVNRTVFCVPNLALVCLLHVLCVCVRRSVPRTAVSVSCRLAHASCPSRPGLDVSLPEAHAGLSVCQCHLHASGGDGATHGCARDVSVRSFISAAAFCFRPCTRCCPCRRCRSIVHARAS